jgi:chemotaxis protein methyltransferase CheR
MTNIDSDTLSAVSKIVRQSTGIHFPEEKHQDIIRVANSSYKDCGFKNPQELANWICSEPLNDDKIDFIAKYMAIGETYFFRDKNMFDTLYEEILPQVTEEKSKLRKTIKIWSAACSTGEEAYTISIILNEFIKDIHNWEITILATDFNRNSLRKALKGVYSDWSIRDNLPEYTKKYFNRINTKSFNVIPEIKSRVKFQYMNLIDNIYPPPFNIKGSMDIIVCKNVLMYFNEETRKDITLKLYNSLAHNGWIFFSPCDLSYDINNLFYPVNFNGTTLYRKNNITGSKKQSDINFNITSEPIKEKRATGIRRLITKPKKTATVHKEPSKKEPSVDNLKIYAISDVKKLYEDSRSLFRQGKYEHVIAILLKFTDTNPEYFKNEDSGDIATLLCRSYINTGAFKKAKLLCEKILAYHKMNPDIYYLYATLLKEENKITEAIDFLKKSLYLDNNYFLADFTLGVIYKKLGKIPDAKRHFANARLYLGKINDNDIIKNTDGLNAGHLKSLLLSLSDNHQHNE